MPKCGYVYILASKGKRLYIGITTNLEQRIWQHKHKVNPECFTARYNIDRLVYFERHPLVSAAIAREKALKGWLRIRKIALIVANNPNWRDLSAEWGQPLEPMLTQNGPGYPSNVSTPPDTEILRCAQDDDEPDVLHPPCRHPERSEGSPYS